jgi:hypothetical protein
MCCWLQNPLKRCAISLDMGVPHNLQVFEGPVVCACAYREDSEAGQCPGEPINANATAHVSARTGGYLFLQWLKWIPIGLDLK